MTRFESQPDPDTLECDDPTHGAECTCGAAPDLEYERGVGL